MPPLVREMAPAQTQQALRTREWLVTNGLGGFASGTVDGAPTRRYHGLLIAALAAPLGRMVMLARLDSRMRLPDGGWTALDGATLSGFRLEDGLPVWRYAAGDAVVERRLWMAHGQNTCFITYRLVEGTGPLRLSLRPALHVRPLEAPVSTPLHEPYTLTLTEDRHTFTAPGLPPLRMRLAGERALFTTDRQRLTGLPYPMEAARGYASVGDLWSPGEFRATLTEQSAAVLVATTEAWEMAEALTAAEALAAEQARRRRLVLAAPAGLQNGPAAELVVAADQFLITPAGRVEDAARARAAGDEARSVIAGYHWFTDWGRDTMISLEGLTVATGRAAEAGRILRTFAAHVRDGLIPNMFPEGEREGLYHTADATLWFFHALDRYVTATGDRDSLQRLLPVLEEIIACHVHGTRFGIGVDPADGLLRQGAAGYQLTWMDAKAGDWVVTPRRGKAVEINALWYYALCLLERWTRVERGDTAAAPYAGMAKRVYRSFNERFWYAAGGYLYDVVDGEDGEDAACRPNQLFALSLPHAVLAPERWATVLAVVQDRLLTPFGLRSLAPGHPDYQPRYDGDLRSRDAAYHQGTVWSWLIGPYIDAWLRVYPEQAGDAAGLLDGLLAHLGEAGIGSISEVFDAEPPFTPGGCIAQAWGVAELLRSLRTLSARRGISEQGAPPPLPPGGRGGRG